VEVGLSSASGWQTHKQRGLPRRGPSCCVHPKFRSGWAMLQRVQHHGSLTNAYPYLGCSSDLHAWTGTKESGPDPGLEGCFMSFWKDITTRHIRSPSYAAFSGFDHGQTRVCHADT
jgi:hypothetical protein